MGRGEVKRCCGCRHYVSWVVTENNPVYTTMAISEYSPMPDFTYIGSELELFAEVRNWKAYWAKTIAPFIHGDVIEVGAGLGSNTPYLDSATQGRWVCLEPDSNLAEELNRNLHNPGRPHEIVTHTIDSLDRNKQFDTAIYIDVLEHIEDDKKELELAAELLRSGGRIIVLSPAHQWLFTPFDAAIGHYRRYNRTGLRSLAPRGLALEKIFYLDSAGLLLSAANRLIMRQSMPTKAQLAFWDGWVIPLSRTLDKYLRNSIGKSIVAVWKRT